MSDQDSGSKTEQPTPKRLLDARKKGQVPKSRDLTSVLELLVWGLLAVLALGYAGQRLMGMTDAMLAAISQPFSQAAPALAGEALTTLLAITAACLIPVVLVGVLTEFLQAGPVWSMEKMTPKIENMNPVEGIKRMFTMDNVIEVLKSIAKTALLLFIGWMAVKALLPQVATMLLAGGAHDVGQALWAAVKPILGWTLGIFLFVALLDVSYQRFSFMKKMRMSRRDILQEMKDSEGDPHIKQQRRQLAQEMSQRSAQQAARQANVLVVNPTHVAIAIDYDRENCPVPCVAAKGEEHVARAMREAAEEAGVPIVRNEVLARDMLARAEEGEVVPSDLFDIIAEVILWAREVRDQMERGAEGEEVSATEGAIPRREAPGEDLTRYAHRPGAAAS